MLIEFLLGGVIVAAVTYFVTKKIDSAKYEIYIEQAKQKAKAIESEAQIFLEQQKVIVKEKELELKKSAAMEVDEIKRDFKDKSHRLNKEMEIFENRMLEEKRLLDKDREKVQKELKFVTTEEKNLKKQKDVYQKKIDEIIVEIARVSSITASEAKDLAIKYAEKRARGEIAHIVRKAESEAKDEAKRKANFIIAQATTKFAGSYASERLINNVALPGDELKGRIIGKEGRNIKALETLLGVDIIIDDTPNMITVSSFNLYRRAIATKTIELLVEDGRIQPAKIEEIFQKVTDEFEESLMEEGKNIVMDLGIGELPNELIRLVGRLKFRASYGQNALAHSLEVAYLAGIITAELDGDQKLAKRAGLLHDIGKALTQDSDGNHVDLGGSICKRYKEDPIIINAIYSHHGHEDALSIEAAAVCAADALSAARPGARREVLENFLKRVKEIEAIAMSKEGVNNAYAISAGREVRVILNADLVNDSEAVMLAKEIATDIEQRVQYPGEIKVNVIRETRVTELAK